MSEYRQVRVLLYPGRRTVAYAVVARRTNGHGNVDRVLCRGALGDPDAYASTGALLRAVSDAVAEIAERL